MVDKRRLEFLLDVLAQAAKSGAVGQVTISDSTKGLANSQTGSPERMCSL